MSFEGASFLDPIEEDTYKLRMVHHFAKVAGDFVQRNERAKPSGWQFSNLLSSYEYAVNNVEDGLGIPVESWGQTNIGAIGIPDDQARELVTFAMCLGNALVGISSSIGARLLWASASAANELREVSKEADIYNLIGQYHLKRGLHSSAIQAFRLCEKLHGEVENHEGVLLALGAIGISFREEAHIDLAIQEFKKACELAREWEFPEREIDLANCAMTLLIREERYFEATTLGKAVLLSLAQQGRDFPSQAELLVQHSIAHFLEGDVEESREIVFSAIGLARTHRHRPAEARGFLQLGRLYHATFDDEESMKWFRRARSLFAELSDQRGVAESYLEMARLYNVADESNTRSNMLTKALQSARAARDGLLEAEVWHERYLAAFECKDMAMASAIAQEEISALHRTKCYTRLVDAYIRRVQSFSGLRRYSGFTWRTTISRNPSIKRWMRFARILVLSRSSFLRMKSRKN